MADALAKLLDDDEATRAASTAQNAAAKAQKGAATDAASVRPCTHAGKLTRKPSAAAIISAADAGRSRPSVEGIAPTLGRTSLGVAFTSEPRVMVQTLPLIPNGSLPAGSQTMPRLGRGIPAIEGLPNVPAAEPAAGEGSRSGFRRKACRSLKPGGSEEDGLSGQTGAPSPRRTNQLKESLLSAQSEHEEQLRKLARSEARKAKDVANQAWSDGNLSDCLSALHNTIQLSQSDVLLRFRSRVLTKQGEHEAALKDAGDAVASNPMGPLNLLCHAACLQQQQQLPEAGRAYMAAMALGADSEKEGSGYGRLLDTVRAGERDEVEGGWRGWGV